MIYNVKVSKLLWYRWGLLKLNNELKPFRNERYGRRSQEAIEAAIGCGGDDWWWKWENNGWMTCSSRSEAHNMPDKKVSQSAKAKVSC